MSSVVVLGSYRFLLVGPDSAERLADAELAALADAHGSSPGATPRRLPDKALLKIVLAFGVLAACGGLVEDAGASWGAIYLREDLGAAAATAGLAFVALQSAMTVGRLLAGLVALTLGRVLVDDPARHRG